MEFLKNIKNQAPAVLLIFTLSAITTFIGTSVMFGDPQAQAIEDMSEQIKEDSFEAVDLKLALEKKRSEFEQSKANLEQAQREFNEKQEGIKAKQNELLLMIENAPKEMSVNNFTPTKLGGIDDFLKVNGAEFVQEAGDIFRAVGLIHSIKPSVLVCIAQADSSLGKALKSTNNIGNVGNNDRGDTVHYPTLQAGVNAMGETLNNQYLGKFTKIGELSNGGRKALNMPRCGGEFKCYATSEINWNRNVIGCLQNIEKDETINESWGFRK